MIKYTLLKWLSQTVHRLLTAVPAYSNRALHVSRKVKAQNSQAIVDRFISDRLSSLIVSAYKQTTSLKLAMRDNFMICVLCVAAMDGSLTMLVTSLIHTIHYDIRKKICMSQMSELALAQFSSHFTRTCQCVKNAISSFTHDEWTSMAVATRCIV